MILDSAVQDDKVTQDFGLESLSIGDEHSQKVKATPIKSDAQKIALIYRVQLPNLG